MAQPSRLLEPIMSERVNERAQSTPSVQQFEVKKIVQLGIQKKRLLAITDAGICNMKENGTTTTSLSYDQIQSCTLKNAGQFVLKRTDGKVYTYVSTEPTKVALTIANKVATFRLHKMRTALAPPTVSFDLLSHQRKISSKFSFSTLQKEKDVRIVEMIAVSDRLQTKVKELVVQADVPQDADVLGFLCDCDTSHGTARGLEQRPVEWTSELRQFLDRLIDHLLDNHYTELRPLIESTAFVEDDDEWTAVRRAIEQALEIEYVRPITDQLINAWSERNEIAVWDKRLRLLGTQSQEVFGIQPKHRDEDDWKAAVRSMRQFGKSQMPFEKILALLECAGEIYKRHTERMAAVGIVPGSDESMLGAEDFFPILIFVLVQAQRKSLQVEVNFLWSLGDWQSYGGEAQYYLTTMEAGLLYLREFDVPSAVTDVPMSPATRGALAADCLADAASDSGGSEADEADVASLKLVGADDAEHQSEVVPEADPMRKRATSEPVENRYARAPTLDEIAPEDGSKDGVGPSRRRATMMPTVVGPCEAKCGNCEQCQSMLDQLLGNT